MQAQKTHIFISFADTVTHKPIHKKSMQKCSRHTHTHTPVYRSGVCVCGCSRAGINQAEQREWGEESAISLRLCLSVCLPASPAYPSPAKPLLCPVPCLIVCPLPCESPAASRHSAGLLHGAPDNQNLLFCEGDICLASIASSCSPTETSLAFRACQSMNV